MLRKTGYVEASRVSIKDAHRSNERGGKFGLTAAKEVASKISEDM